MFENVFKRALVGIAMFGSQQVMAQVGGGEVRSRRRGWCSLLVVCCVSVIKCVHRSVSLLVLVLSRGVNSKLVRLVSSYCIRLRGCSDRANQLSRHHQDVRMRLCIFSCCDTVTTAVSFV
jgi:hypothetical protein